MRAAIYYLSLPLLYLLSWLPMGLLHLISGLMYGLVYHVFKYRKQVVLENLQNAFPDKSAEEIDQVCKQFYRYFCDLSLETIKFLTISPGALKKRVSCDNIELLEAFKQKGQSIILVLGHLGNWEWAGGYLGLQNIPKIHAIYHPLANPKFDQLMRHMRTRLGAEVYPMKGALRGMLKNKKKVTATAFISDQAPGRENAHWMPFLNQKTAVFQGTEIIARKLDYPVVYVSVLRQKRGYYKLHCELLTEHPQSLKENELTEMHNRRLEKDILQQPETWLWTHRRWKQRSKRKS
jgi:KDO2-lipid IV(A) lauroyltransferase